MGGHSAWRKRVAEGGLAKEGTGGAIARHRPRWGRKGEDLKLNKKGNIAGGNPKKKKGGGGGGNSVQRSQQQQHQNISTVTTNSSSTPQPPVMQKAKDIIFKWALVCISAWIYLQLKKYGMRKREEDPFSEA
mmetsp:Transcript_5743/g.9061  ORF Transcript_5743/g.9061 Transcript_5743/m.9061 type:complete len:132 (-) Transcript_5743:621-1016(-)